MIIVDAVTGKVKKTDVDEEEAVPIVGDASWFNDEHKAINESYYNTVLRAKALGEALIAKKAELGHGNWLPWVKENLSFSPDTAGNYMTLAEGWNRLSNSERARNLSLRQVLKEIKEGKPKAIEEKQSNQKPIAESNAEIIETVVVVESSLNAHPPIGVEVRDNSLVVHPVIPEPQPERFFEAWEDDLLWYGEVEKCNKVLPEEDVSKDLAEEFLWMTFKITAPGVLFIDRDENLQCTRRLSNQLIKEAEEKGITYDEAARDYVYSHFLKNEEKVFGENTVFRRERKEKTIDLFAQTIMKLEKEVAFLRTALIAPQYLWSEEIAELEKQARKWLKRHEIDPDDSPFLDYTNNRLFSAVCDEYDFDDYEVMLYEKWLDGETIVVNQRKGKHENLIRWATDKGILEYIDRKKHDGKVSKFGNPFEMKKESERSTVIEQFKQHFYSNHELMKEAEQLRGKVLACWCHPKRCHGDVIVDYLHPSEDEDGELDSVEKAQPPIEQPQAAIVPKEVYDETTGYPVEEFAAMYNTPGITAGFLKEAIKQKAVEQFIRGKWRYDRDRTRFFPITDAS